jgi:urease accessory protein
MTRNPHVWQLVDSAFPSGGFTHSSGIEAAVQHGDVGSIDGVARVARTIVRQTGRGSLPLAAAAHRSLADLPALDARADLFLNQPISNRASRAQGQALLTTAGRVFPGPPVEAIAALVKSGGLAAHYAPMFGAVMGALLIDLDTTLRLFLFQAARSPISAAVRLGVIGMFDGQRLQAEMSGPIEEALIACRDLAPDDIAQTAPILDLYQSTQDRLYSRLFQS